MRLYNESHIFNGMLADLSPSKVPSNIMCNAHNIKIVLKGLNTTLSIINEKNNEETSVSTQGKIVGYSTLNQFLITFSIIYENNNYYLIIDRFDLSDNSKDSFAKFNITQEYANSIKSIEAISYYESENVLKIYWTDGISSPKVINIANIPATPYSNILQFDFIPELDLNENVDIKKQTSGGTFPAGIIQYSFTYYNKNMLESNIFYTSPILYISHADRGGSPEEAVNNSFIITVRNVLKSFDYLRIYSLIRTSLDGLPVAKRVTDINLKNLGTVTDVVFTDTGLVGETIDPTELLYKSQESVIALTLELKDNTLFFGNIELERKSIEKNNENLLSAITDANNYTISSEYRSFQHLASESQLSAFTYDDSTEIEKTVPCSYFNMRNTYRLGLQFQYKTGIWSEPIYIKDWNLTSGDLLNPKITQAASLKYMFLPQLKLQLSLNALVDGSNSIGEILKQLGYKKIRPIVSFPKQEEKKMLFQGVVCPTLYTENNKTNGITAQSSWLFRAHRNVNQTRCKNNNTIIATAPLSDYSDSNNDSLVYTKYVEPYVLTENPNADANRINAVEIQGEYNNNNKFKINNKVLTYHSPDIAFDTYSQIEFNNIEATLRGYQYLKKTDSSIKIETSTPTISSLGTGALKAEYSFNNDYGIISGPFYDDFIVDDNTDGSYGAYSNEKSSVKWMVYLWNRSSSLNNDFNRPSNGGVQSAMLKNKRISNARRYGNDTNTKFDTHEDLKSINLSENVFRIFNSELVSILKYNSIDTYFGNVDTLLYPDAEGELYYAFNKTDNKEIIDSGVVTSYTDKILSKTGSYPNYTPPSTVDWPYKYGLFNYIEENPSLVAYHKWAGSSHPIGDKNTDLVMIKNGVSMRYKSTSHGLLSLENIIPYYEIENQSLDYSYLHIVDICNTNPIQRATDRIALQLDLWLPCGEPVKLLEEDTIPSSIDIYYQYGDSYYSEYECLKTYPFSPEDVNQVVEIGEVLLESYVNVAGRYDRNKKLIDNTNANPLNFNLLNKVYSLTDNFFSYRLLDESLYANTIFKNQITWSKEKQPNSEIDEWTNLNLASTYNLEGIKGEIVSINQWKNQLYCFQTKGISNILFNSRVQIPTSDGVPIEITNGYKVDGVRYLTEDIGCKNKLTIKETANGLYFVDSIKNHLYKLTDSIIDLSTNLNINSWFEDRIIDRVLYDDVNLDIYIMSDKKDNNDIDNCLYYSELFNQFISFNTIISDERLIASYNRIIYGLPLKNNTNTNVKLLKLFAGDNKNINWDISFISNGLSNNTYGFDKMFSNIEYRMDMFDSNNEYLANESFTHLTVKNEYLNTGEKQLVMLKDKPSILKKKFRIWRIDIPRNTVDTNNVQITGRRDRIRNPWCKVILKRNNSNTEDYSAELHDIVMQYYI